MNDRPQTDLTLTPEERTLCRVYTTLWTFGLVALVCVAPSEYLESLDDSAGWMNQRIAPLLKGDLPDFSVKNLLQSIAFSFFIGGTLLDAFHLAYLVNFGRWLRPVTLWFWTMLHALLPVLFMLVLAGERVREFMRTGRSIFDFVFIVAFIFLLGLSLPLFFFSRGLWRRRKSADAE